MYTKIRIVFVQFINLNISTETNQTIPEFIRSQLIFNILKLSDFFLAFDRNRLIIDFPETSQIPGFLVHVETLR